MFHFKFMNVMLAVMTVSPVFQSAFSFQLNNVFFAKCSSLKCPRIIKQNTLLSMLKENQYSNIKAKEQECGDPPKLNKEDYKNMNRFYQNNSLVYKRDLQDQVVRLYVVLEEATQIMKEINTEVVKKKSTVQSTSYCKYPRREADCTLLYNEALKNARIVDSSFGVGSVESKAAWEKVDEIYEKNLTSSQCEEEDVVLNNEVDDISLSFDQVLEDFEGKQLLLKLSNMVTK